MAEAPNEHAIDVAEWLRTLGLDEYVLQFRDNHISGDLLPKLTADDSGIPASSRSGTGAACLIGSHSCGTSRTPPRRARVTSCRRSSANQASVGKSLSSSRTSRDRPRLANCSMPRKSKASSL